MEDTSEEGGSDCTDRDSRLKSRCYEIEPLAAGVVVSNQ